MKPELMQSVLEIATKPCQNVAEAGDELRQLRRMMAGIVEELGLQFAASGTHPFALWEDQKIVERPRYKELIGELGFIARQELIFGTHVHVAIDGPGQARSTSPTASASSCRCSSRFRRTRRSGAAIGPG